MKTNRKQTPHRSQTGPTASVQPRFNGAKRPSATVNRALGAFNPALPVDGSLIVAGELRGQFTALNADIQTRATEAELTGAVSTLDAAIAQRVTQEELTNGMNVAVAQASSQILPQTSNVSNGVNTLSVAAYSYYDQWQMQQVIDKIDELINALRR